MKLELLNELGLLGNADQLIEQYSAIIKWAHGLHLTIFSVDHITRNEVTLLLSQLPDIQVLEIEIVSEVIRRLTTYVHDCGEVALTCRWRNSDVAQRNCSALG